MTPHTETAARNGPACIRIASVRDMQERAEQLRRDGHRIGLVPTMGALHEGHLSLIRLARQRCRTVVVSVFVNPTQFAPHEDYAAYPRDAERDARLAAGAGCDIVFLPEAREMYPEGYSTYVEVDGLSSMLEGASRPTHFRGVTTVVCKLLTIVRPHLAVFGRKDAQQAVILRRMAADLNMDTELFVAPIVREPGGLAMSSRNAYLSPAEREQALALSSALRFGKQLFRDGERSAETIRARVEEQLRAAPGISLDYAVVADAATLRDVATLAPDAETLLAVAARVGRTRLIDNTIIQQDSDP
jgi:pantoate--beta-alanine ligase